MQVPCPACATAVNPEEEEFCPECGCAVAILADIVWSARDSIQLALEAIRRGQRSDALDYAYEAWGLKNSRETAAIGLIAAMHLRDSVEVTRWLKRRRRMCAEH